MYRFREREEIGALRFSFCYFVFFNVSSLILTYVLIIDIDCVFGYYMSLEIYTYNYIYVIEKCT